MSSLLEKSLDEIIGEGATHSSATRGRRRNHGNSRVPRGPRGPRGPRKSHDRSRSGDSRKIRDTSEYDRLSYESETNNIGDGKPYLRVKNLHYELTEQDIFELFSKVNEVQFTRLEFDQSGRSTGVAYVCFEDPSKNNSIAITKFDGKRAAGRNIIVEVATKLKDRISVVPIPERTSNRTSDERRAKLSNRRPGNKLREAKVKRSVDDLDSELENYMSGFKAEESNSQQQTSTNQLDNDLETYMNASGSGSAQPSGFQITIPAVESEPQNRETSEPFAAVNSGDGMALD